MTKKLLILALFAICGMSASFSMSRARASEEADFLTDKMAYELGLTQAQWADVYEINYDYFRALDHLGRSYAHESRLRDSKLKYVLTAAQWDKYLTVSYFITPVKAGISDWIFTVYNHYKRNLFYYDSRHIVDVYRGKHRKHTTFYQNRYQPRYRPTAPVGRSHGPQDKHKGNSAPKNDHQRNEGHRR